MTEAINRGVDGVISMAVVDDEETIGELIQRGVAGLAQVERFTDGDSLVEALADGERYDLILCDLNLPWRSGVEIFDEVAQRWPGQAERMVLMSGLSRVEIADSILGGRAVELFEKPFRLQDLRDLVHQARDRLHQARDRP